MMKYLCFILTFLFYASIKAQDIPKNAKSIIITIAPAEFELTYKAVAKHLIDNGFSIANSDKDIGLINTERKVVKWAWEVRISTSINGNKIKFTGKQFLPGWDNSEKEIRYYGSSGAMFKTCFGEVDRVAKSFPNIAVEYSLN